MTTSSAISGVLGRIASIEERFRPVSTDAGGGEGVSMSPPPVTDFDPFGEVYQQAIAARDAASAVPIATPAPVAYASPWTTAAPSAWSTGATAYGVPGVAARGAAVGGVAGVGVAPMYSVVPAHPGAPPIDAQTHAAIAGVAGPPGVRPVGGYGKMPRPPEFEQYGNGRIPAEAMAPVHQAGSNHRLHAPAAASWNNIVAEAAAVGIDLRITDSYRSYEEQVDLVRRKGLYSEGGLGATPGTSNHGWGLAVDADVTDRSVYEWLRVNGPRYGWIETVPREPWHWEFRPHQV